MDSDFIWFYLVMGQNPNTRMAPSNSWLMDFDTPKYGIF